MRTNKNLKRTIAPDPVYNNRLIAKLINRSMLDGRKTVASTQVYKALEIVQSKTKKDALETFRNALENIKPQLEV